MFQNQTLDVIFYILSLFGFSAIVGGTVVKLVGRKIDKSDKAANERQAAMIQCMVLTQEGRKLNTEAIYAIAGITIVSHGETADLRTAMSNLDDYEKRESDQVRKNAAEFIYGAIPTK